MKSLFDVCTPRDDVLQGSVRESEFAADLAQVLDGHAPAEYRDPALFFANTHPTEGLRALLRNVCTRLTGQGGEAASLFRLDTQYGGGKTHALIALTHAAAGMPGVENAAEFLPAELIPRGPVRVAAFDGENADPVSGRALGQGLYAYTPWGELAYRLAGVEGYERVRRSDEERVPPGADTIRELFGGEPTLILLDELSIYLRKVRGRPEADQLTPFLTGLFKAVESAPGAVLVFTLAVGKGGETTDAYTAENEFIAQKLEEAERVAARQATLIDPTAEHETAQVLRRRLFQHIDDAGAAEIVEGYRALWAQHGDALPDESLGADRAAEFASGYPFHPALMSALTDKLSTRSNFQRVRGMLRLLTRTVHRLWQERPSHTYGIHLHHAHPGDPAIRNEILTRLELHPFDPAMRNDVASPGDEPSLAERLDQQHHVGAPPYTSFVARTILWHTFAFNEPLKGITAEDLRYSILAPDLDIAFINRAREQFVQESGYLDDRPGAPLRFLTEANLEQLIRHQMRLVDPEQVRAELQSRIVEIFEGRSLKLVSFAGGPYDVPDSVDDGRPLLVLIGYEAETVRGETAGIPPLVESIYQYKGAQQEFRSLQNHLVFLVADARGQDGMRQEMTRRLALEAMRHPDRLNQLAEHQQQKVQELYQQSSHRVAIAIQQCYRFLYFPSRNRADGATVDLANATIDMGSASERPGSGQDQVRRTLEENQKLLRPEDPSLSPNYLRDQTPLRHGQMSTAELRNELRKDQRFPIMLGDDHFISTVRKGIEDGTFVYASGDLLYGLGDPWADVRIDQQSVVYTMEAATERGLWPRHQPEPEASAAAAAATAEGGTTRVPAGGPGQRSAPDDDHGTQAGLLEPGAPEPPPGAARWRVEAPLREALTRAWEQARHAGASRIATLRLRLFDVSEGLRLFGGVSSVARDAEKRARLDVTFETGAGSEIEIAFAGPPGDLGPLRDYLDPQMRAAADHHLTEASCTITFPEGLDLAGRDPEDLTEQLTRFAGASSALVEATAEASR